jgi:hypothetical protein
MCPELAQPLNEEQGLPAIGALMRREPLIERLGCSNPRENIAGIEISGLNKVARDLSLNQLLEQPDVDVRMATSSRTQIAPMWMVDSASPSTRRMAANA